MFLFASFFFFACNTMFLRHIHVAASIFVSLILLFYNLLCDWNMLLFFIQLMRTQVLWVILLLWTVVSWIDLGKASGVMEPQDRRSLGPGNMHRIKPYPLPSGLYVREKQAFTRSMALECFYILSANITSIILNIKHTKSSFSPSLELELPIGFIL